MNTMTPKPVPEYRKIYTDLKKVCEEDREKTRWLLKKEDLLLLPVWG